MDDSQVIVLPQCNSLNDPVGAGSIQWQDDFSPATDKIDSESNRHDQQDHNTVEKDFDFIQKHATDADPDFIQSLLDSQAENPKRLEDICEVLGIPNASSLIQEFKQNGMKPGDKRSVTETNADSADSKKQKTDKEEYLQQLREMFPDADGLFLISECQQLESRDDFSRFVNTVMLTGMYLKQGYGEVNYSPTTDFPKVVDISDKDDYRTVVNYSSEEEISSSGLVESPERKRRNKKKDKQYLKPPVVDVIDISSDGTESYDPPDVASLQKIFVRVRSDSGEAMEVEETYQSHTTLSDDIDQLLQDKFSSNAPGPSGLNPRHQKLAGGTIEDSEKSLAEIIEDKRSDRRRSIASPIELGPSTSKGTTEDGSVQEVSGTSEPKPETVVSAKEEVWETEWLNEQTANLIRIFPNTDPSYLREEVSKMNGSSAAVNEFVVEKLEKNDMPTRAEYEKKREMEELQNRYTKNFSIEDFLKAVPDPWKYFSDVNRNCSKYKSHSLCYLKSNFRKHYVKDMLQVFSDNKDNLYLTYQALKKQEAKCRYNRRSEFECNRGRPTTIDVQFLQEVAFIENEDKIKEYLEAEKIARQIKFDEAKRTGSLLECQCCFDAEVLVEDMFYCPNDHAFCRDCITKSVEVEMGNGRYQFECLTNCNEKFTLVCLQNALKPELFSKVIRAIQMEEIRAAGIEDLVQCPFCNYATIMPPEEKVMACLNPECLKESCRLCKELNHVPLRCDEVEKSEEVKLRTYIENKMTEALVRTCYKCSKKFVKEDGCNKMTCTCGAKMCYVCRKPVSGYSHFNAQGGTEYQKCPLYSMNDELHVDLVKRVAEEAKAEVMQANPRMKLLHDPTIILPERSSQQPIPGINNGAALDVAMRAIRGENNTQEEPKTEQNRRRHTFSLSPIPVAESDDDESTEEESEEENALVVHDYSNYVDDMAHGVSKSHFSDVDEYGFERAEDFDYQSYEEFMSSYIKVLAKRSKKWEEFLGDRKILKKNAKLKRYIRKGIPAQFRGLVWFKISGAEDMKNNMADNFYKSLLKQDLNAGIVESIKLDLHRTFPNNIFFKSAEHCQTGLFNILVAYAHHNPKVGYCQGLNYIAGLLLLVTKNEETSFWLLKILVEHILEDYYSSTMEGLIVDLEVMAELIRLKVPDVHSHISILGLPWPVICTKWFICLFAEVLPIETVLRIWDCLFYEGSKIFFRVAITLIKLNRQRLLGSTDYAEAVTQFKAITRDKFVTDCHLFMESIFKVPGSLSNSTILKLRERISEEKKAQKPPQKSHKV